MAKITTRKETGKLVIDFTFRGVRCREQTALNDTNANRKRLQPVVLKLKQALSEKTLNYADFFPSSAMAQRFEKEYEGGKKIEVASNVESSNLPVGPTFRTFANQWVEQHSIEWRRSHIKSMLSTLNGRLMPHFAEKVVSQITKSDVLDFRATLAKVKGRGDKDGLSPKRINEIIGLLRQILNEAADRYEFTSPVLNIKKLRQPKPDVHPFSLVQVQKMLYTVRPDYRNYLVTRFFTGMRTGEVHGLKWKYVDFDLRIIRIRETFVLGEDDITKTEGSQRDIQMSQPVYDALREHKNATGSMSDYVFCNRMGQPLDNKNFSDRIWYPLLSHLGFERRRPYQMRHTAATLWLASGEAPEWIARQLGHTSTEMLFRVYSRYVPNLTRQDGSAMERLLASKLSTGPLIANDSGVFIPMSEQTHGDAQAQPIPKPRGRAAHMSASANHGQPRSEVCSTPHQPSQPPPWMRMAPMSMHASRNWH